MAHERQSALDQRAAVRVVLVDFKKAFDSVNHNILLNKLYEKNIPHCLIKWFVSYLQHRTQRVHLGSDLSIAGYDSTELSPGLVAGSALFLGVNR